MQESSSLNSSALASSSQENKLSGEGDKLNQESLSAEQASKQYSFEFELRESVGESSRKAARELADAAGVSLTAARILLARGLNDAEKVKKFLSPSLRHHLPNPAEIKNIIPAADLLLEAIAQRKVITVYSDFDVDGLSAGSQLVLYLQALGAVVHGYTPSRFTEGYGLVRTAVERLAKAGTQVLVTVDCGITSHNELALAKQLGMQTVVLDHHIPNGIPPADVVVDPAQDGCPFQEHKLAAAGLVWMLLIVLRQRAKLLPFSGDEASSSQKQKELPDPKDFLDLAALGTICDMVPLVGVNRVLAARGVEAMKASTRPGLLALRQVAGVDSNPRFSAGHVAFALGPRINAAGRLADASEVFTLLTTKDSIRAKSIASSIDRLNDERRQIEDSVKQQCLATLQTSAALLERNAFALFGETYHIGVIGIVAQRIVEQYHKPTAVMAVGEATVRGKVVPVIKGSVRSIKGFHVADALQSLSELLITHGGHAEAGGFSLARENLEKFQEAFVARADQVLTEESIRRRVLGDIEIQLAEIDFDLVNELQSFQPFGVGNPAPLLIMRGVDVHSITALQNKHLRLRLTDGTNYVNAVAWGMQGHPLLRKGQRVAIAYYPELNTYQGISAVQLNIKEVLPA